MFQVLTFLSAFFASYLVNQMVNKYLKNRVPNPTKRAVLSFAFAAVILLVVITFTFDLVTGVMIYIPCLIFWLVFDLIKIKQKNIKG